MTNLRLVLCFLGTAMLLALVAIALLSYAGKDVPDVLVALATGALGSLGGLLVPARAGQAEDG